MVPGIRLCDLGYDVVLFAPSAHIRRVSAASAAFGSEMVGGRRRARRPRPTNDGDRAGRPTIEGAALNICKSAKRSQCFGVGAVVDWLEGQVVRGASETVCHVASFVQNWLRSGVLTPG